MLRVLRLLPLAEALGGVWEQLLGLPRAAHEGVTQRQLARVPRGAPALGERVRGRERLCVTMRVVIQGATQSGRGCHPISHQSMCQLTTPPDSPGVTRLLLECHCEVLLQQQ